LTDLGFTVTQARVYVALCRLGISTAREISTESQIARQDIYRILTELAEMGFVEKALTIPAMFESIPLTDAIDVLMEARAEKSRELEIETEKLLPKFNAKDKKSAAIVEGAQFFLTPKGNAYLQKAKEAIKATQNSIDCVTSYNRFVQMMLLANREIE
jgi:sugar-specific transcriptional regulator TrmB